MTRSSQFIASQLVCQIYNIAKILHHTFMVLVRQVYMLSP